MADHQNPEPIKQHGVPEQTLEEVPMGLPSSDRHHTETTPAKHDKENRQGEAARPE
jgi:hypothetical protein